MNADDSRGDAAILARELTARLEAIATPAPSRSESVAPVAGASPSVTLVGPRTMVENAARFVTPSVPAEARLAAFKRLALRALRIVTRDQTIFNSAIAESLRLLVREVETALAFASQAKGDSQDAARRTAEAERRFAEVASRLLAEEGARERLESALAAAQASSAQALDGLANDLTREAGAREALERDRDVHAEALARARERADALERRLASMTQQVRRLELEPSAPGAASVPQAPSRDASSPAAAARQPLDPADPRRAGVYFDFEARFRGSEEEIKERQRRDAELFRGAPGPVVDLGCGRGEFVELLKSVGVEARGCDANPLMAARAREKGLDVVEGDLFELLRGREDASLGGITAYQVVEHLPVSALFELVELAAAKLASGGRILLETINPESVYAMRWFWMDLTHVRPVPAGSLEQLLHANGFFDVTVDFRSPVPASETAALADDPRLAPLSRFLFAPQDYAVPGVK
jgi:O-antigen chain-terminating methyltransferase